MDQSHNSQLEVIAPW